MLSDPPTSWVGEFFQVTIEATLHHLEVPRSLKFEGNDNDALTRFYCWALVHDMPNDGLEECWSTIKDIHQFYSVLPGQVLPVDLQHH